MSAIHSSMKIPDSEIEAFARCILPAIQAYFESEEGQQEFKKWEEQNRNEGSCRKET